MTLHQTIAADSVFDPIADLKLVRAFLHEHGTALAAVAFLLGGGAAGAKVFLLIDAMRDACGLTRNQRRQLADLYRLLTLEHAGDPGRIAAARFAGIDPAAPIVDQICLLAEKLEALLLRISAPENGGEVSADAAALFGQAA